VAGFLMYLLDGIVPIMIVSLQCTHGWRGPLSTIYAEPLLARVEEHQTRSLGI